MARQPRFEYPGAVYHVMARGDGGKRIFVSKQDHESFLYWMERVCTSHGWRVHAWVLMDNHIHLLLETPEANLIGVSPWVLRLTGSGLPASFRTMARQPRFEYPGAVYHVMARGDGGKAIFVGKEDHDPGQSLGFKIDGIRPSRQFSDHGKATEIRVSRRSLSCDGAWRRWESDFCGEGRP